MSHQPLPDELPSPPPNSSGAPYRAELAEPESPPPRQSWATYFFIVFMIGVVVGPLLVFALPGEIARWHQAATIEQWLDGDLEGAIRSLSRTIEQYPREAGLYLQRAEWYRQIEQYQAALQDCDRVLSLAPDSYTAYQLRSQVRQHLGDYDAGVEDMKRVLALSENGRPQLRPSALNGLAYARALAKSDLEEALDDVQQVMSLSEGLRGDDNMRAAVLDTRGYIHFLQGDLEQARADLDEAVKLVEQQHDELVKELTGDNPSVLDLRRGRLQLKEFEHGVAVIRYHRALLYAALQMKSEQQKDLQRVRELGYEPVEGLF